MNPPFLAKSARHLSLASAVILIAGCAAPKKPVPAPVPPAPTSQCPSKYPQHHVNVAQHYSICLPANLSSGSASASGFPAGTIVFTGFSVPAGTNLLSKRLIIQPGADDLLQTATAFGQLTAGGVTFQRMKETDAGAGQQYLNIIYVWKHAGQQLNFVFEHHAVNPGIIGPPSPAVYNQAAQVKITEEIMRTFRPLH